MTKTKAKELEKAFKPKFQEIDAEKIFKHLFLRNPEELRTQIQDYNGDEEKLKRWMNSFVAAEKALSEKHRVRSFFRNNNDFFHKVVHGD